ncbi:ATP-binding protein [Cellulomonas sp. McL0617]|uniref:ATP-binding protein n=1 Tax=Cellulomonas sp. McL0617 TaxID=3415675 RepID=UPI003CFA9279
MLRLWILGPMAAARDDVPLGMPTSERARALIGWLALHPGPRRRTDVAALLWPTTDPERARANLRTAIWATHRTWGEPAVEATRSTVALVDGTWVDATDDPAAEGELLPGLDDEWVVTAREERERSIVSRLVEEAETAEVEGDLAAAVRLSERVCRLAPYDEGAHRLLIRRLLLAGDRATALLASREFSERLSSELGVRPSPATRAAHAAADAGVHESPRPRLYGRADEVARLTATWRSASRGGGRVAVITGEAGIGKSSLLAELAHRVEASGGRSSVALGVDAPVQTPFAAWLEVCQGLVATAQPVPAQATWPVELNRLSDGLGTRLGHPGLPPSVTAPELERLRVFESVLRLVEWSCADRPTMIALDDAHRVDRTSMKLTGHIGRHIARLPLLLVLTIRDGAPSAEADAMIADLAGRGVPVESYALEPLEERAVAALVSSLHPLGHDVLDRVVAAAEGNPLLAVESARAVVAGGEGPPANLRIGVRASLGRLPPNATQLAQLLAVAGQPLSPAELDRLEVPEIAEAEDAATAEGLLVRRGARLGFRHDLLRDAVYAEVRNTTRLHDRIASSLDPTRHADVARHLASAGRELDAARSWAAAAAAARAVGALDEAREFLVAAAALTPDDGALWLELEEIDAWAGRHADTEAAWSKALALLPEDQLPAAWCRRGRQFRSVVCNPERSRLAYRSALGLLPQDGESRVRADVLIGLAWGEAVAGSGADFEGLLAGAESLSPTPQDSLRASDIAEIRMLGLIRAGRFADAVDVALTAAPYAGSSRSPDRAFALLTNAACALTCMGDHERALALADRAVEATRTVPSVLLGSLAARAQILARLGRHEEALATVRRQQDLADRLDDPALSATAAHDAGLVALAAGRHAEAAELLAQALALRAPVSRPGAALRRAEALALDGRPTEAAEQLRAAVVEPVRPADQPWALVPRIAFVQALIALARGDEALATRRLDESADAWSRVLDTSGPADGDVYLSSLVDLGRPPVIGLVEPARELARIDDLRLTIAAPSPQPV